MKIPRRSAWTLAAMLLLGGALLSAPASAGDWHYLSGDASESTLDCFGDFEDARCAAETELACATWSAFLYDKSLEELFGPIREDLSLCTQVEEAEYPPGLYVIGSWRESLYGKYLFRLSEPWVLQESDLPGRVKGLSGKFIPKVGDTAFDVEAVICGPRYRVLTGCIDEVGEPSACNLSYCIEHPSSPVAYRSAPEGTFRFPFSVLVMRKEQGQWRLVENLVAWHDDNQGERRWRPLRYRIGPVEE